ncbi:MAG TPA: AAA family ATPase, partial [Polyangiaceae bacterium]
DALLRFKNEFRALQDLHHPNLVSLGELFEDAGRWFFTMEFVDGTDLLSYLHRRPRRPVAEVSEDRTIADEGPLAAREETGTRGAPALFTLAPLDESRLRDAMVQLVRGVRSLHAAGQIHRDIKTSNVIVTAEGRVVLLDFGLLVDARRAREEAETHLVVGTEKYMAPEQAAARPVGPKADCYSLGVVLYRCLTGQFPFGEATGEELVAKQQHVPPAPIAALPSVPRDLNALCLDLLRAAPEDRPSCDEILERLQAKPVITGEARALPSINSKESTFIGRTRELAALGDAFAETLHGKTRALVVIGESGVGKSTLVRCFAERMAEEVGAVVLAARCYERESVPFKAVDGIVDALSRVLARSSAEELANTVPRRPGLLAQAFPVLRRLRPFAEAAPPWGGGPPPSAGGGVPPPPPSSPNAAWPGTEPAALDPKEQRAQLFGAVRELLGNLAARTAVILVIDDLQWSDGDSLALLRDLLRPPGSPPLLLLATARPAPVPDARAPVSASPFRVSTPFPDRSFNVLGGEVRTLYLDRLDPTDARELARQLLERVSWAGDDMADRIAREAKGHPLFIDELVRHALQGGEERARSARLEDALGARVERLERVQRQVLDAVAVSGGPLRLDVLSQATSIEVDPLGRVLTKLRVTNLVRATGVRRVDLLDTYHDRVRDAALARMDDDARRTWHRRIAMAIEALAPTDVEGLVTHWSGARDGPKASHYALRAAAHASDSLAFDRAARMYKLALSFGASSDDDQRAIRANLGFALVNAGRGGEAAEAFLAAAEGAPADVAIDLRRRAAEQLLSSGHHDRGLVVLEEVLHAMGMDVPRTPRSALASLLVRRGQLRLRGLDYVERTEAECEREDLHRLDMLSAISGALGMVDSVRGADFQTRHALMALKIGEPTRVVRALSLEAAYCATGGTRTAPRTAQILARVREIAARFPNEPLAQGWAHAGPGVAAFLEGRWKDCAEACAVAVRIFREECAGQAFPLASANFYFLAALVHMGEMRELGRRIPALIDEAKERGDRHALTQLRTGVVSMAWLARGDTGGARREAEDAIAQWSTQGTHLPHFLDVLAQAQIDLYEGEARAALARVEDRWEALADSHLLRVQFIRLKMWELRGRAALAVAGEGREDAEAQLEEAERCANEMASEKTRWSTPLVALLRAGIAARRGERDEAIRALVAAEPGFIAERMALHVATCRWLLAEIAPEEKVLLVRAAAHSWMKEQAIE